MQYLSLITTNKIFKYITKDLGIKLPNGNTGPLTRFYNIYSITKETTFTSKKDFI